MDRRDYRMRRHIHHRWPGASGILVGDDCQSERRCTSPPPSTSMLSRITSGCCGRPRHRCDRPLRRMADAATEPVPVARGTRGRCRGTGRGARHRGAGTAAGGDRVYITHIRCTPEHRLRHRGGRRRYRHRGVPRPQPPPSWTPRVKPGSPPRPPSKDTTGLNRSSGVAVDEWDRWRLSWPRAIMPRNRSLLRAIMTHLVCGDEPDHPLNSAGRQSRCRRSSRPGLARRAAADHAPGQLAGPALVRPDLSRDLVRPGNCRLHGICRLVVA